MSGSIVGLSILVGSGRTTHFSLIQAGETLFRTSIGIALVIIGWGVLPAIAAMVVVRWVALFAYWRAVKPLVSREHSKFDWPFFIKFIKEVPTFAGITLLAMLIRFAPQAVLPWMLDDAAAGQFAAAYMFIDLVMLVPNAVTTNLGPLLARKAKESTAALLDTCRSGIKIMLLAVVPVAAIVAAVAQPMFAAVFPHNAAYSVSATVLSLVIWTCCFQVVDSILSVAIISRGKQNLDFITLVTAAAALISGLFILIPRQGVIGAGLALLVASAAQLLTRLIFVAREIGRLEALAIVWRPALAAIAALFCAMFMARTYWLAGIGAGGLIYIICLWGLRCFAREELESLIRFLQLGSV